MDLEVFVTPGLGDASYLLASGGEAVLVDPQRDAWRFLEVAERRRWRVTRVVETHVHNDYLSGAIETRAATGAEIVAPARGGYRFEHQGVEEGDAIEVGSLRLTAMATPGHTPEHLAWLVHDLATIAGDVTGQTGGNGVGTDADGADADFASAVAVFTGGSLIVGSAGRTDLLGPVLTDALTADQQRSLRRLAELPDAVRVLPTHGAGSFCAAGPGGADRTTTIGAERFANPTFRASGGSVEEFRAQALGGLGRFPAYYAHMAELNRRGPRVLQRLILPDGLDPEAFETKAHDGATVVDARDRRSFAAGHVAGALNIELDESFAAYVGWLVPFAAPILLVLPDPPGEALVQATTQLLRIGYERVPGWLEGGVTRWAESGRALSSFATTTMRGLHSDRAAGVDDSILLDVRQPIEWASDGVIPGSERIFVADLPARIAELPAGSPVTVFCRSGSRATIAASLLDGAGRSVTLVSEGGATRWPEPLERPTPE